MQSIAAILYCSGQVDVSRSDISNESSLFSEWCGVSATAGFV
jgi:hypothetical protein